MNYEPKKVEDYRILRSAWISVALKRYPHIATHIDQEIIDLLLDEKSSDFESYTEQEQDPRVIVTIKKGPIPGPKFYLNLSISTPMGCFSAILILSWPLSYS